MTKRCCVDCLSFFSIHRASIYRRSTHPIARLILGCLLSVSIAGCSLPNSRYQRPGLALKEQWRTSSVAQDGSTGKSEQVREVGPQVENGGDWWRGFGDPTLTALIERAVAHNHDVDEARLRIDVTSAQMRLASVRRGPDAAARLTRDWRHDRRHRSLNHSHIELRQELDVWGAKSSVYQAALAREQAQRFQKIDTENRVTALTAQAYWRLAALQEERLLAQQDLGDAERGLEAALASHEAGASSVETPAAARQRVADYRATLAVLDSRYHITLNALSLLQGTQPGDGMPQAAQLPREGDIPRVPEGVPAELLARRPDLQVSEWRLRASLADSVATRARFYPRISLTASLGAASNDLLRLVTHPASMLTGQLLLPFIEWRETTFKMAEAQAEYKLAESAYIKLLHQALTEVEDALTERMRFAREYEERLRNVENAREREKVMADRFQLGRIGITPWLDSRQSRRVAEASLLATRLAQLNNMMKLYQALGGDAKPV